MIYILIAADVTTNMVYGLKAQVAMNTWQCFHVSIQQFSKCVNYSTKATNINLPLHHHFFQSQDFLQLQYLPKPKNSEEDFPHYKCSKNKQFPSLTNDACNVLVYSTSYPW